MESGTLEGLLKANGLPDDCLAELLKAPYNITTINQFANFFDDKAEVSSEFCSKTDMFKDRGDLVANIKQAWREAEAMVQRSLKRTIENVSNESLEEPLKYDDAEKLEKAYTAAYGVHVPPTWMGFSTLLGRFHREFTRRAHTFSTSIKSETWSKLFYTDRSRNINVWAALTLPTVNQKRWPN